ncbi:hypothetical protein Q5H93_09005 [Hymenobacter sp. ASUV-10]|uniref:DUF4249 domain-containing protein n=1 Tax=Hymenobacter aranciens TaxID=3063996 RepID=A0ABT9B9B9_9BACT|nr:hypothetical protein [Hymenobacter sp. ASUV-10]MDO7874867.1 hypothetical protein [Hymenobacter sp. ASUV-10]
MRFRLLFLLLPLLAACAKEPGPVRFDFVGATGLTSSDRSVSAGDTLITRAYVTGDNLLKHLRITVTYEPQPNPVVYPDVLTSYDPSTNPSSPEILYLDSTLATNQYDFGFRNRFGVRTTSGVENWRYTVTDASGNSTTRGYRIVVRKADSAAVLHNYTMFARLSERGAQARPFLQLQAGLLLPRFALRPQPGIQGNPDLIYNNQRVIDAVLVRRGSGVRFVSPSSDSLRASTDNWARARRKRTVFTHIAITNAAFNNLNTVASLRAAFVGGSAASPDSLFTRPLVKPPVVTTSDPTPNTTSSAIAFRTEDLTTKERKYGVLFVSDVTETPYPGIRYTVRMQK